jgi:hypothetical protein
MEPAARHKIFFLGISVRRCLNMISFIIQYLTLNRNKITGRYRRRPIRWTTDGANVEDAGDMIQELDAILDILSHVMYSVHPWLDCGSQRLLQQTALANSASLGVLAY